MRLWMEQRMNGQMTPAFIRRRLYAGLCAGLRHRLERRSQRGGGRGGGPFLCSQERPPGSCAPAGGAGLRADGPGPRRSRLSRSPSPLGHGPQSGVPKGPAPIPRCSGLRVHGAVARPGRSASPPLSVHLVTGSAGIPRNTAARGPLRPERTPL